MTFRIIKPNAWLLDKQDDVYFVMFDSGELIGRNLSFTITEEDYWKSARDELALSDLIKKYQYEYPPY